MPATTSCLRCREMKVKCRRESDSSSCWRCNALGQVCQTVPRKLGRKLGSRNKPKDGALLAAGCPRPQEPALGPHSSAPTSAVAGPSSYSSGGSISPDCQPVPLQPQAPYRDRQPVPSGRAPLSSGPLNHLCDDIREAEPTFKRPGPSLRSYSPTDLLQLFRAPAEKLDEDPGVGLALVSEGMHALFSDASGSEGQIKAEDQILYQRVDRERLDVRPDWDPLTEGVVSQEESRRLMTIFWEEYHPRLRVLDPVLHTLDFIRARSSFLYSVILLTAAWSLPLDGLGVKKRLARHLDGILPGIWSESTQSIEIIQALLIHATWLRKADQDKTWMYLTRCVSMVVELRLDCPLPPSVIEQDLYVRADPETQLRLIRNSQRAWLSVLIRDRSLATTRGRDWLLPEGELVSTEVIVAWHLHPLAAEHDPVIAAQACLRTMHFRIKDRIVKLFQTDPSADFDALCAIVDRALARCRGTWSSVLNRDHLDTYDSIARFIRFILLVTPYEHRLQSETLADRDREECLVAAMASLQSNLVAFKAEADGKPPLVGPHFIYCLAYVGFHALKIMLLRTDRVGAADAGAEEVELFHLSIIAQAALQLQRLRRQGMEEIGAPFGARLLQSARSVARRNAESTARLQHQHLGADQMAHSGSSTSSPMPLAPRFGEDDLISSFPFLYDSIFDDPDVAV